jgi:hypothetical protein
VSGQIHLHARSGVSYGAKLNLAACRVDEPEYRKKHADSGSARYRAQIVRLAQGRPADIGRELDTVAVIGGEVLKIISRR